MVTDPRTSLAVQLVKTPRVNARNMGLIPVGMKIPHTLEEQSPCATNPGNVYQIGTWPCSTVREATTSRCKRRGFDPWVGKMPWGTKGQPTPVFLPVEGQRSLVGYSPRGRRESDTIEATYHAHTWKGCHESSGADACWTTIGDAEHLLIHLWELAEPQSVIK